MLLLTIFLILNLESQDPENPGNPEIYDDPLRWFPKPTNPFLCFGDICIEIIDPKIIEILRELGI